MKTIRPSVHRSERCLSLGARRALLPPHLLPRPWLHLLLRSFYTVVLLLLSLLLLLPLPLLVSCFSNSKKCVCVWHLSFVPVVLVLSVLFTHQSTCNKADFFLHLSTRQFLNLLSHTIYSLIQFPTLTFTFLFVYFLFVLYPSSTHTIIIITLCYIMIVLNNIYTPTSYIFMLDHGRAPCYKWTSTINLNDPLYFSPVLALLFRV